ncbi:MAG: DNA polymerase III subunit delta' [Geminicoccaceae bacterium]
MAKVPEPEPRVGPAWTPFLLGHEAAEARFTGLLERNRLPHAWLLSGTQGVGKATLAYRMARLLLAAEAERVRVQDPEHPLFRQVAAGAHPDLKVIDEPLDPKTGKLKSSVPVDLVRLRMEEMYATSMAGGRRVMLIDPDVDLGANSANALLKLLEEPPAGAYLIIMAQHYSPLPVTIASRCARLRLRPLAAAQVTDGLLRLQPELGPARAAQLAELARGSIGRALELHAIDWPGAYGRLLDSMGKRPVPVVDIAEQLLKLAGSQGVLGAGRLLGDYVHRAARFAATGTRPGELVPDEAKRLRALPGVASLDRCALLWEKLAAATRRADALNLEPLQTLIGLVDGLVSSAPRRSPAGT